MGAFHAMTGPAMETGTQSPATGRGRDAVAWRRAVGGRDVAFLATALIPGRLLRLWGAVAEAENGDGVFIRLGILGAGDGWSVTELLSVARGRFEAELARTGEPEVEGIILSLERAAAVYREPLESGPATPVSFETEPGAAPSPYGWTVARAGLFAIPLCPGPDGQGGGITPEQLLVVIDLALGAWLPVTPWRRSCWQARRAVRAALAIEARRAAAAARPAAG